jgi:hypothetical protein
MYRLKNINYDNLDDSATNEITEEPLSQRSDNFYNELVLSNKYKVSESDAIIGKTVDGTDVRLNDLLENKAPDPDSDAISGKTVDETEGTLNDSPETKILEKVQEIGDFVENLDTIADVLLDNKISDLHKDKLPDNKILDPDDEDTDDDDDDDDLVDDDLVDDDLEDDDHDKDDLDDDDHDKDDQDDDSDDDAPDKDDLADDDQDDDDLEDDDRDDDAPDKDDRDNRNNKKSNNYEIDEDPDDGDSDKDEIYNAKSESSSGLSDLISSNQEEELNIVDAYIKYNKQLIIFISGVTGTGLTKLAKTLSRDLHLGLISYVNYLLPNTPSNTPSKKEKLPDNTEFTNWDTDDIIDWPALSQAIHAAKSRGVIVMSQSFPTDKLDRNLTVDAHIRIKLSFNNLWNRINKHLEKNNKPTLNIEKKELIFKEYTYPYYLQTFKTNNITKYLNANEAAQLESDNEDAYNEHLANDAFKFIIDLINNALNKMEL